MAKATKPATRTAYRDAGNGQLITKKEAERRPANTVVKEKLPLPAKKK
ncbi:multidrug transporter [Segetibacter aerophilus]|uniref:Uncharacterized protein n=1 Tax=Segetibacter aerophilus TaxID=670293 RepID=A0A512BHS5_9BACT|nr:multidrug transporter [Segetibacter aerophilus]GEO11536.1 hypothetical protein SAE01_40320 [Segetibacter aerophilus]